MESQAPTAHAARLCTSTAVVSALCALVVGCHTRVASVPAVSAATAAAPMSSDLAFDSGPPGVAVLAAVEMPGIDPRAETSAITPKESVAAAE